MGQVMGRAADVGSDSRSFHHAKSRPSYISFELLLADSSGSTVGVQRSFAIITSNFGNIVKSQKFLLKYAFLLHLCLHFLALIRHFHNFVATHGI